MTLLSDLHAAGVRLALDGDRIRVRYPAGMVDADKTLIQESITRSRESVIKALSVDGQIESIRAWLNRIGETDPEIVRETIDACRGDAEKRRYFFWRSLERF